MPKIDVFHSAKAKGANSKKKFYS